MIDLTREDLIKLLARASHVSSIWKSPYPVVQIAKSFSGGMPLSELAVLGGEFFPKGIREDEWVWKHDEALAIMREMLPFVTYKGRLTAIQSWLR